MRVCVWVSVCVYVFVKRPSGSRSLEPIRLSPDQPCAPGACSQHTQLAPAHSYDGLESDCTAVQHVGCVVCLESDFGAWSTTPDTGSAPFMTFRNRLLGPIRLSPVQLFAPGACSRHWRTRLAPTHSRVGRNPTALLCSTWGALFVESSTAARGAHGGIYMNVCVCVCACGCVCVCVFI